MNLLDLYSKDMCHVCGQTPCNCTHIAEEKVRLDPSCWHNKKIGNPKTKIKGGVRVNNCVPAESVAEGYDEDEGNPVMNAIRGRIMRTRPDLLGYDLRQLQAAIRDVALDVGDVDEIGTSDINGWVKRVEQQLSGTGVAEAKADPTSTWVVYNGDRVKRFKTHQGAKAYAEQHGGKVASSAHYADKIQGKQGVAEAFIAPALSAANANAEHRRQGAAGGGYRGRIDIPVQSREDYISAGRALKKAAAAAGQKIEYGLSNGVMSVFSDSMDSDALDQFIDSVLGQGVAEGSEQINWIKPNFDFEWHEVEEQSKMKQVPIEVRQYYQKHFPNKEAWLKSVQNGRVVTINPDHNFEIRNAPYDKESLMQVLAPTSHEGPIGPAKQKRVNALFDKGGPIEMPIILKTSNGLWLIGGKTRLGTANYIKGIPAKVWMIGGEQGVAEGLESYPEVLYHGSTQEIKGPLTPRQAHDIGGAPGSNKNAIYATDDPNFAIAYSLAERGSDTGTLGWKKDPHLIFFGGKIRHGQNVYIYILPTRDQQGQPLFTRGAADAEWHSVPGVKAITPIKTEVKPVDQYLHLLRKPTSEELKIFQANQAKDKARKQGVAEGTAHDPAKLAQGWAQRYPNIDADIAAAKKAIDPNYEYASGSAYQRGKDAQDHLTRLLAIKKIINDGQPKEQSGLGFGENKEQEADYGDKYQSMVQRVGQRAREQEKTRPVDIQDLARRLRAIEQSKDDK